MPLSINNAITNIHTNQITMTSDDSGQVLHGSFAWVVNRIKSDIHWYGQHWCYRDMWLFCLTSWGMWLSLGPWSIPSHFKCFQSPSTLCLSPPAYTLTAKALSAILATHPSLSGNIFALGGISSTRMCHYIMCSLCKEPSRYHHNHLAIISLPTQHSVFPMLVPTHKACKDNPSIIHNLHSPSAALVLSDLHVVSSISLLPPLPSTPIHIMSVYLKQKKK